MLTGTCFACYGDSFSLEEEKIIVIRRHPMKATEESLTFAQLVQFYEQAVQPKIDEVLQIVREERGLNNSRFLQLNGTVIDLRKDMTGLETSLRKEIRHMHDVSSQDFLALSEDLTQVKKRLTRLEKKIA
jgi:hypothetical protein